MKISLSDYTNHLISSENGTRSHLIGQYFAANNVTPRWYTPLKDEPHLVEEDLDLLSTAQEVFLLVGVITWRMLNALVCTTYGDPDEHWQSLEVAHRLVFGYGHQTWEWTAGIRSWLFPLPFVAYFSFLKHYHLDSNDFLMVSALEKHHLIELRPWGRGCCRPARPR